MLQLTAAGAAGLLLPGCGGRVPSGAATAPSATPFLTDEELAVVDAASERLFPGDASGPGARDAGVVDYIQGLLSLEPEGPAPMVFAGGPFSGRNPYLDVQAMAPSAQYPPDSFRDFVPLTRVQRLAWTARLHGAADIDELAGNPLAMGTPDVLVGLQDTYRSGVQALDAIAMEQFSAPFVELAPDDQDQVLQSSGASSFADVLLQHTLEGMFAAPEYGGNRELAGWQLSGYGGDSQPLGYIFGFDEATGTYVDRADMPDSSPNPGETCAGLSADVESVLRALLGGQDHFREFTEPQCIGVAA